MTKYYNSLAKLFSIFFSVRLHDVILRFCKKIYWFAFVKQLKSCGGNSYIQYPFIVRGPQYITLGHNTLIAPRLRMDAIDSEGGKKFNPQIIIGNNVIINFDCHIGCVCNVKIGDNVLIAGKVYITDHSHGDTSPESLKQPPASREIISKGPVIIENNVWIGECVSILPNVKIGENSIIGANSVVTKDVPPNTVVAGVPARIIKSFT